MTAFKKVSVKERLPDFEVFCISESGYKLCGYLHVETSTSKVICENENEVLENIQYWLEEIKIPSRKEILGIDKTPYCGCDDYENGLNEILELFK